MGLGGSLGLLGGGPCLSLGLCGGMGLCVSHVTADAEAPLVGGREGFRNGSPFAGKGVCRAGRAACLLPLDGNDVATQPQPVDLSKWVAGIDCASVKMIE